MSRCRPRAGRGGSPFGPCRWSCPFAAALPCRISADIVIHNPKETAIISNTTTEEIISWLTEVGEVVTEGDLGINSPLVLEVPLLPNAHDEAPIFLAARYRRLGDNSHVLRLEMPVRQVSGDEIDVNRLRVWASIQSQSWMCAHVRIDSLKIDDRRQYMVRVEYSLPAHPISKKNLHEVIDVLREAQNYTYLAVGQELKKRRQEHSDRADDIISSRRVFNQLDDLVGLAPVKTYMRKLAARQWVTKQRKDMGLRVVPTSPHLIFTGNPGTGKTTVARLVGKLYKSLGILDRGHVVEVNRGDLVSGYLGQTALKTTEVCKKALGGVLFIDEAYSLDVDGRDYGREAVETLLTFMEAHRGQIAVIVAGYPEEMEALIDSNPGLRSRFDSTIHFPDYTDDELLQVFRNMAGRHDYRLGEGVADALKEAIAAMPRGRGFGNAREMRRLFDEVVCNHAMSMMGVGQPTERQLELITRRAVEMACPPRAAKPAPEPKSDPKPTSWSGYL